jgi:hypothetical protein
VHGLPGATPKADPGKGGCKRISQLAALDEGALVDAKVHDLEDLGVSMDRARRSPPAVPVVSKCSPAPLRRRKLDDQPPTTPRPTPSSHLASMFRLTS